jgi:putative CocE/NonD family hydrolase
LVSGRTSQEKIFLNNERYWAAVYRDWFEAGRAFKELETHLRDASPTFKEWVSHPQRDTYWESYNPTDEEFAKIAIPVLTITGLYDSAQLGALEHYKQHLANCAPEVRARHYLVIGPWDHAGTRTPALEFGGLRVGAAGLLDLGKLHIEWYAWTMQRGPKPPFLQKNVAYYVMVADQWRYADTLEAVTASSVPLYLHSSGNPTEVFAAGSLIAEAPRESGPDQYIYDPRDVSLAELESTIDSEAWADDRMVYASAGKQLVYHSAAFDRHTDVCGFFRFIAWLAIDQPDTDFRVSIYDVGLDGSAIQLTCESLRARYRESLGESVLVRTREPLRYEFDRFTFVSRRIRKGHRLRLVIDPLNSIYSQKNYNSGGVVAEESMKDARTVTVRIFHDPQRPSALYVPLAHRESSSNG